MKRRNVLFLALCAAFFGFCTFLHAQEVKPAKVLLFSRTPGFPHGPVNANLRDGTTPAGRAMNAFFKEKGKNIEVLETRDGSVFDGDLSKYDGFVFSTVADLMGGKDERATEANGFAPDKPMTEQGLKNLIAAIRGGKGLVGWHNATDSFSNVRDSEGKDIYTNLIGARFISHGPQQTATVVTTSDGALVAADGTKKGGFPFLKGVPEITIWEEWYAMKNYNKDLHVLLVQKTKNEAGEFIMKGGEYQRDPFPIAWIRLEGKGRVGYASFGHSEHYFEENPKEVERWGKAADNLPRITELIEWSIGRFDADTTPNIDKAAPNAGSHNDGPWKAR